MKKIEYFWELEYPFAKFLTKNFPNTFKRKYSMTGNGIYNLVIVGDKFYEVKFSKTTSMLADNNLLTTDKIKNKIIENICDNLKSDYTVNNGKITMRIGQFIAKVEVVKKMKMPE
jgi:hypothetical protein